MKKILNFFRGIIFILILIVVILFIAYKFDLIDLSTLKSNINSITDNETIDEIIVPDDYKNTIENNSNVLLNDEIMNLLTNYMNLYFKSLYTLELQDNSDLFADYEEYYINNNATKLMIESRKLYDYEFTFNKGYYDLEITNVEKIDDTYTIYFLEDDTFYFNFLNGIESKAYDIENEITIKKIDESYKIVKADRVQGEYVMFTNSYSYNNASDESIKEEIDSIYNKYYNEIKQKIENEKNLKGEALTNSYTPSKECENNYNREAAVNYSYLYINTRNDDWFDYSELGGNCQNYVSQAIYNGGINMDYSDNITSQWKHFSTYVNENKTASGRSYSWTGVDYFYTYVKNNKNDGICGEVDINLYYADIGDVIQVGYNNSYRHSVLVSKIVDDHILVNSNSNDLKDYPLDTYVYPLKRLIKILGEN